MRPVPRGWARHRRRRAGSTYPARGEGCQLRRDGRFARRARAGIRLTMRLDGKIAVVTGASRGIGRAIALRLAREGAQIVVNFNARADAAEDVAVGVRDAGRDALVVQADVARSQDVERLVSAALDRFSRIDILVNNAGITRDTLLMRMSEEDWDAVLDTNLKSAFLMTKA